MPSPGRVHEQEVREVTTEKDVRRCWHVFKALRPHLTEDEFVRRWHVQRKEAYELVFIESDGAVLAAAGYRVMNTMAWGKIVYLDDLIASTEHQGRGLGSALLLWLQQQAKAKGCNAIHLDTGYQRHAAHKAYLRNGFELNCHHLAWTVS